MLRPRHLLCARPCLWDQRFVPPRDGERDGEGFAECSVDGVGCALALSVSSEVLNGGTS
jgi:hypothetical protein